MINASVFAEDRPDRPVFESDFSRPTGFHDKGNERVLMDFINKLDRRII